jgi:hypothetical protein
MATDIFNTNPPISDDDRGAERARWLRWSQLTLSPDDAAIVGRREGQGQGQGTSIEGRPSPVD